jgi:predicted HAD superfamily Cof-like phosphohydrolase
MYPSQKLVLEFMNKFNQKVEPYPIAPEEKIRVLRVRLLLEEVLELAEASGVNVYLRMKTMSGGKRITSVGQLDVVSGETEVSAYKVADALADIMYVNDGAANAWGIDLQPIFEGAHENNMSKIGADGRVHYDVHHKVIKPDNFVPFNVYPLVKRQIEEGTYRESKVCPYCCHQIHQGIECPEDCVCVDDGPRTTYVGAELKDNA